MTMKPNRCLLQPPTQQTSQSPNREPSVTAVQRRRNLVSGSIGVCGHHIDPSLRPHSQLALWPQMLSKTRAMRLAFPRLNQPILSHMPRTSPQRTRARNKKTGFRPGRSGACEARLFRFIGQAHGEGEPPAKQVAACDVLEAMVYIRKWHPDLDILRVEFVALIEIVSGSPLD